jgi:hypothetical protein
MTAKALVQTLLEIYGRIGDFHVTPCDGAIPVSEADRLAEKAIEDYANATLSEERAAVVAWLRKNAELNPHLPDARALVLHFSKAIEDGAHRKGTTT